MVEVQNKFKQSRSDLEKILKNNILPFWYPQMIDSEGGYCLNHDSEGKWRGPGSKFLVTQARMVWFFSYLFNTGYGTQENLKAASHGVHFLCERMWDSKWGGFFWEVDHGGRNVLAPDKHLYGQAFGLFALAEYGKATRDSEVCKIAHNLFELIERHGHDEDYGGYQESFQRDWKPSVTQSYMFTEPGIKLLNTHVHLIEAFTVYYQIENTALVHQRLVELILVLSHAVVCDEVKACTDRHQRNWTHLRGGFNDYVCYGEDLESSWLIMEACKFAGIPQKLLLHFCRGIFEYALKYGYDAERGGFFSKGFLGKAADKKGKIWWIQAEALVGVLYLYRLTQENIFWEVFRKTLDWIIQFQVDWKNGDWHFDSTEELKQQGGKAGEWKDPYHQGRAMIKCLELLNELEQENKVLIP